MFDVIFPAFMIVAPVLFLGLWCFWTGVVGLLPMLLATLACLVGFGSSYYLIGPSHLHSRLWAMLPFFGLLLGMGVPLIRRAFVALPQVPRGAALKPRRLELFPFAFVWPMVAWAAILSVVILRGDLSALSFLGPALGLFLLLILKPCLDAGVKEPEPLGGADPGELAARYKVFRRKRTCAMYWMSVSLSLLASASGQLGAAWAVAGPIIGLWGGLFGTWADAQRYLLRLQLSGAEPPGGVSA